MSTNVAAALTLASRLGELLDHLADGWTLAELETADQSLCHEGDGRSSEVALGALVRIKRAGVQR